MNIYVKSIIIEFKWHCAFLVLTVWIFAFICSEGRQIRWHGQRFRIDFGRYSNFFCTGACSIPPMGFEVAPEIKFHQDSPLPTGNTCSLYLSLPLCWRNYNDFKQNIPCKTSKVVLGCNKVATCMLTMNNLLATLWQPCHSSGIVMTTLSWHCHLWKIL